MASFDNTRGGTKRVYIVGGSGSDPATGGGTLVGLVNATTTAFPTAERLDYVKVDPAETNFPFTVRGITFNNINDSAIYTGTQWVKYSFISETDALEVSDPADESLAGDKTTQQAINIENKTAIVDIQKIINTMFHFRGYISNAEPTGNIQEGLLWYQSETLPQAADFPIPVHEYKITAGVGAWTTTTVNYSPTDLDLWANRNDDQGYYWFIDSWNKIDSNIEYFKAVNTFNSVDGDERTLYYLNADYDTYKKGFYLYNSVSTEFNLIGGDSDVFIDAEDILPSTNLTDQKIYRLKYWKYFNGTEEITEPIGMISNDPAVIEIDSSGITHHIDDVDVVVYAWADLTDTIVNQWVADGLVGSGEPFEVATFFKVATDTYVYMSSVTRELEYDLYHNPSKTATGWLLIGGGTGDVSIDNLTIKKTAGKLQANAIIDVESLPTVDILDNTIYRIVETTPIRMVKLFTHENGAWINHSRIEISQTNYNMLTSAQKNDGTIYIIDDAAEVLIQFTYETLADKPSINGITLFGALTLEDLSLYSRAQIDALLANKGSAEFVDELPATLAPLTWYYSKKFQDGTDVPNDKRALYIVDKDSVVYYMGIVGDIDLSEYYTKAQADVLLASKIDTAGTGLSKSGTTLNHSNSITAQTTQSLRKVAYDAQGHITGSTDLGVNRGIDITSNNIGHSNTAITAATTQAVYPTKIDKYGHVTAYGTGQAITDQFKSSASNQLLNRVGANAMWKGTTHLVGIFKRESTQNFSNNSWANVSLTASNDTDGTYCNLTSSGIKVFRTGIYRFDIVIRLADSIASNTFAEWAVGVTGHDDDLSGGNWFATLHRHKGVATIFAYVTANSIVYPRLYVAAGTPTLNYCAAYVSCVKES